MAAITTLPRETLDEILSNLSCPDLASMTRVSRHFHFISQPLLYTSPYLGERPETTGSGSICSSLGILLRTLLIPGHEILASHVRSICLVSEAVHIDKSSHYSNDTFNRFISLASKFSIHAPTRSHAGQFMVLLDLLPRLEVLHISRPVVLSSVAHILKSNITTAALPCGLQSLSELHCYSARTIYSISSHTLVVFMKLPRIRIIDVPDVRTYMDSVIFNAAAASSAVTHLRFSYANMSPSAISQVLLVPIALTHFSYTASMGCGFDIESFMAALTPLRVSVRSLHLDFRQVGGIPIDYDEEFQIGNDGWSLREWPFLQTLSCSLMPLLCLKGSPRMMNLLPVSLRELGILRDLYGKDPEEAEQIVEMLEQKQWAVPRLGELSMELGWGASEGVVNQLTMACKAAGVSLVQESFCW